MSERQEHEHEAAIDSLTELLFELGFPPGKAEGIARWVASLGEDGV